MISNPPVVAPVQSKTPEELSKWEKILSVLMVVLGVLLIVGTLAWLAGSTDGALKSKETVTTEPTGGAAGEKEVTETDYADTVVVFSLTIGAILILSGGFFARIKEIKVGTAAVVMRAPGDEKKKAEDEAERKAKERASSDKEGEAGALARTLAGQQIDVAYVMAPTSAKPAVADMVAETAATAAIDAVDQ